MYTSDEGVHNTRVPCVRAARPSQAGAEGREMRYSCPTAQGDASLPVAVEDFYEFDAKS